MSLGILTLIPLLTPHLPLSSYQACYSEKVDVTTSSTSYPSQYTFPRRNDYCLVIRKIDKICQDNFKKIVFERHYRGRFSCDTFPADMRRRCQENPRNVINSPPAEQAATAYARENLALIKIFIRSVGVVRGG